MSVLHAPVCTPSFEQSDTVLQTWFERDRANVSLSRMDRDGDAGETIVEWWDGAVSEAIEDGFLKPRDYHGTAYDYAKQHGMIPATAEPIDLSRVWPALVQAFVRATPASERPDDHSDCLDWYSDQADDVVSDLPDDPELRKLSPRQIEEVKETLAGALYDMAVASETEPGPLQIRTGGGPITIESDGRHVIVRDDDPNDQLTRFTLPDPDGVNASFTFTYPHDVGDADGVLAGAFSHRGSPLSATESLKALLSTTLRDFLAAAKSEIDDLVLATREWQALSALNESLEHGDRQRIVACEESYDQARQARAASFFGIKEEIAAGPRP